VTSARPWRVHSVFARAFNLIGPNGVLLSVVTRPLGNGPATIVAGRIAPDASFTALLTPGDAAQCSAGRLVVADRLNLDLCPAALWDPPPVRRTVSAPELEARLGHAALVAAASAGPGGLSPLLPAATFLARGCAFAVDRSAPTGPGSGGGRGPTRRQASLVVERARAGVARLATAIRAERWDDAQAAARALSGLGPGLTPAGDDLLAGLALGLRAASGVLAPPLALALRAAVQGRTTDLAAARVEHAIDGRADEAVHRLLSALVSGAGAGLEAAVTAALAYGHSSGADTLVGLLVGLELGFGGT
jgi:hypothetical protein